MAEAADPTTFGGRMRQLRRQQRLSLRQLADLTGLDYSTLSKFETGALDNPSLKSATRIAIALRTSLDYLAGRFRPEEYVGAGMFYFALAAHTSPENFFWRSFPQGE